MATRVFVGILAPVAPLSDFNSFRLFERARACAINFLTDFSNFNY